VNLDPTRSKRCPFCLAINQIDETRCFLCDREFGAAIDSSRSIKKTGRRDQSDSLDQYTSITFSDLVGSFFLVVLIFFTLGVLCYLPGVGVLLAIIVAPALLRTLIVINRRKSRKEPPDLFDQAVIFFVSVLATVGVLLLVAAAGFILLFLLCISR
jgi:hypothetical protein